MPKLRLADCRGDWAVVTGASAGIGREFAQQLFARGIHVALVARRLDLLESLAKELEGKRQGRAVPIALDLTAAGAAEALLARLTGLGPIRLRLLVNNAGSGLWGSFDPRHAARHADMLQLNCAAMVAITGAVLPLLQQATPAGVINVSSQAAYQPVPYMAIYAASKAFVHSFSQALHEELAASDILVQTLVPAPTATQFDAIAGAYSSKVAQRGTVQAVVDAAFRGLERGAVVASNAPGLWKQRLFAGLAPPATVLRQVGNMFRPPKT